MCGCKSRIGMPRKGKFDIADSTITAAKTGAEVLVGYGAAEYLADTVGAAITQANTNTGRILVKAIGTVGTAALAFSKMGRKYKADILTVAGGMAANTVSTAVKNQLPANLQALLPTVNGIGVTPFLATGAPSSNARRNNGTGLPD